MSPAREVPLQVAEELAQTAEEMRPAGGAGPAAESGAAGEALDERVLGPGVVSRRVRI
jgi:hypothetical protein